MMKKCIAVLVALAVSISAVPAFAAEEDSTSLTLEEAVAKAKKNSTTLKKLNASIELIQEEVEDTYADYYYSSDSSSTLSAVLEIQKNYADSLRSKSVQEESLEYSLMKTFVEIINAQRELALNKISLQNEEAQLLVTRTKLSLGLIDSQTAEEAEAAIQKSKTNITMKEQDIAYTFATLNILLGESTEKTYSLLLEPEYEPLEFSGTLDSYIKGKIATDPNVEELEKAVKLAEDKLDLYDAEGGTYNSLKNAISTASLSLQEEKTNLEKTIRSQYQTILTQEQSYEDSQQELATLQAKVELAKTKLSLNLITSLELQEAEYQVEALQSDMEGQIYQHMLAVKLFEKPYLS